MIYDTSGHIVKEIMPMDISTYDSNKDIIHISEKDFQKYHGHYGDTCKENLGGIIWKESEGIFKIYFVGSRKSD